ncbi:hypothetical protein [Cellulomonas sp. RIT-PI-Y]|uniref:hypothetical protein n=1 Tax=Cellulomonas sp. RIT-PI-Y TaxID=3035297 RepID=UPI0021D98DFE|nr:hypothetical protein [Cellulomonas sp. RIT-PI-Y]
MSSEQPRPRFRRPAMLDPQEADQIPGGMDPALRSRVAHTTATAIVHGGRAGAGDDPALVDRLVHLVESEGLDTLAALWADCPATTLPGTMWRLYVLREWVRRDPATLAERYRLGLVAAEVPHAVAGVVTPPGPGELREVLDAVLSGVYTGDLAVALERGAAFCRVLATGAAFDADHLDVADAEAANRLTRGADGLLRTAEELEHSAGLWRSDQLE